MKTREISGKEWLDNELDIVGRGADSEIWIGNLPHCEFKENIDSISVNIKNGKIISVSVYSKNRHGFTSIVIKSTEIIKISEVY